MAGAQIGWEIAHEGMSSEIVVLAATPHSSVIKSLSMLGIGSNNIVKADTVLNNEICIRVAFVNYLRTQKDVIFVFEERKITLETM